jgi:hypothetical protein
VKSRKFVTTSTEKKDLLQQGGKPKTGDIDAASRFFILQKPLKMDAL